MAICKEEYEKEIVDDSQDLLWSPFMVCQALSLSLSLSYANSVSYHADTLA